MWMKIDYRKHVRSIIEKLFCIYFYAHNSIDEQGACYLVLHQNINNGNHIIVIFTVIYVYKFNIYVMWSVETYNK